MLSQRLQGWRTIDMQQNIDPSIQCSQCLQHARPYNYAIHYCSSNTDILMAGWPQRTRNAENSNQSIRLQPQQEHHR